MSQKEYHFLKGGGETGAFLRAMDWENTPFGLPDTWDSVLKHTVRMMLDSPFSVCIGWGRNYLRLYNDHYIDLLGPDKHPNALGRPISELSPATWGNFAPAFDSVMKGNVESFKNLKLSLVKNNVAEDAFIDISITPLWVDENLVGGVLIIITDNTEKVRVQEKLAYSEQQFRNLVMQAPVGIVVFKGENLIVELANEAMLPIVGKTKEAFVGHPLFEVMPEVREKLEPIAKSLLTTGIPFFAHDSESVVNRFGKEELCYFNSVWQPLYDARRQIEGIIVVTHEVTEQVRARKKTENSERRFRTLVSEATVATLLYTGRELKVELVNDAMLNILGKDSSIIGKTLLEILPEMSAQPFPALLDAVYTSGLMHSENDALVLLNKNGKLEELYMDYSYKPLLNERDEIESILVMAVDTTERVITKRHLLQSEQNLRNTILKAPVAMCIFKGDQYVVEIANDKMLVLWGRQLEDVLDIPVFQSLPEAKNQGLELLLNGVYTTGNTFSAQEVPIKLNRKNGMETVYINFVYEAYKENDGQITGIIAVASEVTDQVLAKIKIEEVVSERTKELKATNANLEKSNAELEQFAYIASHDLQEPLRKVNNYAQMLEHSLELTKGESINYLNKIKSSASRMTTLVRDVLSYSQLSKEAAIFEKVDLQSIVRHIETDFELLIKQTGASLVFEGVHVVEGIPLQLSQLLANLISNAIKFSRPGIAPIVTVRSLLVDANNTGVHFDSDFGKEYYKIEVEDNGIGIPHENAEKIFNIFQRLHRKNEYEGTGIGLAICKKIVHNHHGSIFVRQGVVSGSVFTILLPKYKP